MRITREELEAQGIFIPTEVNDELLARFRAGSKILIELLIPTYNFKVSYWTPVIISHDNNGLIFKDNNMCRFAQSDQFYPDGSLICVDSFPVTEATFKDWLECLKKNC
jgi:hypothetical protein